MSVCQLVSYSGIWICSVLCILSSHVRILESSQALKGPILPDACRFSQFRCSEGAHCLETEKLCNGVQDCPLGEDETEFDCTRSTLSDDCPQDHFRCRFGGCIKNELRCNGVPDCWGGTDEARDFCNIDPRKLRIRIKKPNIITSTSFVPKQTIVHTCTQTETHDEPAAPSFSSIVFPHSSPTPAPVRRKQVSTVMKTLVTVAPKSHPIQYEPPMVSVMDEKTMDDVEAHQKYDQPMRISPVPPTPSKSPSTTPRSTTTVSQSRTADGTCPVIELELGQKVSCFQQKLAQEIQCEEHVSPEGTRAEISCKQFWTPPETGPNRSFKLCKNGEWVGGSVDFVCELDCGTGGTAPSPYVTGGQPSEQGKWPWHAGMYENNPPGSSNFQQICGATLVTRQAVLTAAHCVTIPSTNQKRSEASLRVYLGKYFRPAGKNNEFVQPIGVSKIVVHHKYNYAQLENDIALLRLEQPVRISAFVHPVCMPAEDTDAPYVGDDGVLAGWGSVGDRQYPDELREARLPVRSNRECTKNSPVLANLIRETTFCAGHKNGTAACDGDSGGGLVFRDEYNTNKFKIYGVVSGGVPRVGGRGCDPNYFVAFTRVSSFRKWIDRVLDSFAHLF